MAQDKQALRLQLKAKRQSMAADEAALLSQGITERVLELVDWPSVNSLHAYLPIAGYREVDTQPILSALWQEHSHIKTATWQKKDGSTTAAWLQSGKAGAPVPAGWQFDVIIVPLLGFGEDRHRIGFGGGFYDKFLQAQPTAVTIGLCYQSGHVAFQPELHDIPLMHIVTEKKII
jgi:5-formyltetrahydrofolate cyclo-ligase